MYDKIIFPDLFGHGNGTDARNEARPMRERARFYPRGKHTRNGAVRKHWAGQICRDVELSLREED
jgi:hypothetical protein